MAIERVRAYLEQYGAADRVLEFGVSSATVELAAKALGCEPGRIAKSLSFGVGEGYIVIVTAGDCKIDNAKYKAKFHAKARMLTPPEVEEHIGHAVGGVCPFGVNDGVAVYLDESLRRFGTVFPACREQQQRHRTHGRGAGAVFPVCGVGGCLQKDWTIAPHAAIRRFGHTSIRIMKGGIRFPAPTRIWLFIRFPLFR